ncbi:MAG: HAMP domain-containing sensor histidine kinase [Myxococcota bacterium]|nr:HAMP domain-containing sensor histidine kinase [Myxococcota bacterium]
MSSRHVALAMIAALGAVGVFLCREDPSTAVALAVAGTCAAMLAWRPGTRPRPALDDALRSLDARIEAAAEERHRMRLAAETAGRFREEFVAAVRHELKTPLNAILGFSDVLLHDVDGPLSDAQREDVEAIRSAGTYLQDLVEAVLAEWVPSRDTPEPLAPVDLCALVREVARLLEGQLPGSAIRLEQRVSDDTPAPMADARRLRQVLINLGTNAIRATRQGAITLEAAPHEDGVRLTVRDTGAGIAEADLPKLFEEFTQLGAREGRRGGTGLGLALTRDLVEWHGGRIEVESELGVGSAFHVLLPTQAD